VDVIRKPQLLNVMEEVVHTAAISLTDAPMPSVLAVSGPRDRRPVAGAMMWCRLNGERRDWWTVRRSGENGLKP
ncbi:MAG: hypothetical protein ACOC9Y_08435, partial [Chloroflexota bacterium]